MPRRRSLLVGGVVLLVLGGSGAVLVANASGPGDAAAPAVEATAPTAVVTRGDLRMSQQVQGELGFGSPVTVLGRGEGVITWLPSAGLEVARGEQLYRVDDAPVAVLYGDLPLYRRLAVPEVLAADAGTDLTQQTPDDTGDTGDTGSTGDAGDAGGTPPPPPPQLPDPLHGRDVDLLATNLAALGYWSGATTDVAFGSSLADAVREWQEDRDLEETGIVDPADVVVTTGPVRVDGVTAQVSADAAGEVLSVTGTEKVIVLQVGADLARSLEVGRRLQVAVADGTRVAATVRSVGTTLVDDENGGPPTLAVVVRATRPKQVARAPLGPVTADVVTAARRDVLQVPLTALVSLAGGGFAVERPDTSLVPVEIGMVADGQVEVTGVDEGTEVVVAG